jgi:hypothetical protein
MVTNADPVLAPDAAIVLGIAATAIPFARTAEDEAERWLWILRLYGEGGAALQALGVGEARLEALAEDARGEGSTPSAGDDSEVIALVTEHAVALASQHGSQIVRTTDILLAVLDVYGADFDRVLRAHGSDSRELIERLATQ